MSNPDTAKIKLEDCEDLAFLKLSVYDLWGIIDDIDTTSDMVKSNDAAFRERVERLQSKRWEIGIHTDGYELYYG
ncbi:MAG: hypothetical protein ACR2QC_04175 [Gammaproteobacteria bacterium]